MTPVLLIALGATLGATLRYYLTIWAATQLGISFPYGTLLVNGIGSFVLGFFLIFVSVRLQSSVHLRMLVATGFCGSLTTFSTFSYETVELLNNGNLAGAFLNMAGSLVLGLLAVVAGIALARTLFA
jgi:CrcB protein